MVPRLFQVHGTYELVRIVSEWCHRKIICPVEGPASLSQQSESLCNTLTWSFRPLTRPDRYLPSIIIGGELEVVVPWALGGVRLFGTVLDGYPINLTKSCIPLTMFKSELESVTRNLEATTLE